MKLQNTFSKTIIGLATLIVTSNSWAVGLQVGSDGWPLGARGSIARTNQGEVFTAKAHTNLVIPASVSVSVNVGGSSAPTAPVESLPATTLFRTDTKAVLEGSTSNNYSEPFELRAGLYELGGVTSSTKSDYYLLVEGDINNPGNILAFVIPKSIKETKYGSGWILTGVPMNGSTQLMLVDFVISSQGNATDSGMYDQHANFIKVIRNPKPEQGKEFFLVGKHPLLAGRNVWGMKVSQQDHPLLTKPQLGTFGGTPDSPQALIAAGQMYLGGTPYRMVPLNGENSGFIGLTSSETNTTTRQDTANPEILGMMAFVTGACWGNDVILSVQNDQQWGKFTFRYMDTDFTKPGFIESLANFLLHALGVD